MQDLVPMDYWAQEIVSLKDDEFKINKEVLDIQCSKLRDKKTLTNDSNMKSNLCNICFDEMIEPSFIRCGHNYCYLCLMEWSKTTNKCPTCKKKFRIIEKEDKNEKVLSHVLDKSIDKEHEEINIADFSELKR